MIANPKLKKRLSLNPDFFLLLDKCQSFGNSFNEFTDIRCQSFGNTFNKFADIPEIQKSNTFLYHTSKVELYPTFRSKLRGTKLFFYIQLTIFF
jgi:hypothetical protein